MLRKAIIKKMETASEDFQLRGSEVQRIEAFSDAVFAFAVTLLIVSLEVPKNFEELMATMKGFIGFGVSFFLLLMIWYEQNIFFRRYGMDDLRTIVLNCILIFLVLFYVYPLKFLFSLLFTADSTLEANPPIKQGELPKLMMIYGIGYVMIYLLFALMYIHALRNRNELQLSVIEEFDTRSKLYSRLLLVSIGLFSILTSFLFSAAEAGKSGMVYLLIGPALTVFYSYRGRKRRKIKKQLFVH